MLSKRDNFTPKTKQTLYRRCGAMCSHPQCGKITFGPSDNPNASTNIGFAAHIKGAKSGGPRYDETQTSKERKSPENGLWLCGAHAKLIDDDELKYTVELLTNWKNNAEERALNAQNNPPLITNSGAYARTRLLLCRHFPNDSKKVFTENVGVQVGFKQLFGEYNNDGNGLIWPLNIGDIPKGYSKISIICDNQGLGIDKDISFHVELASMGFIETKINEPSRMMLLSGGGLNSTSAKFTIPTLLPNEAQGVVLLLKEPNSFTANITSFGSATTPTVMAFDLTYTIVPKSTASEPKIASKPLFHSSVPNTYTCEIHGKQSPRRVCQHIASTIFSDKHVGFNVDVLDPGEFYDAWCDKCNGLMSLYDNKWLPEMMPLVRPTIICSECYNNKNNANN
jgi:hypothetical protein